MSITPLTELEIEYINTRLTPFNHSQWKGRGVTVTNEGRQQGRVQFISDTVRQQIVKRYSLEQLKTMSIVDVGCYDGWMLHQLEDLPFRRMVGVEPRLHNIRKGEEIRRMLGIESRVVNVQGGIGITHQLVERFDIVLCLGVLHHLDCHACALKHLDAMTKRLLILETIVLPSRHITPAVKTDTELKDLIYQYTPPACGLTGHKFESSTNDGSAARHSVVSIPSTETLLMHLYMMGYEAAVVAAPEEFKAAMPSYTRPSQEAMIAAIKGAEERDWSVLADHERTITETVLPRPIVERLRVDWKSCANIQVSDPFMAEILTSIPYSPDDLVQLEYGKLLLREGRITEGRRELLALTRKLNSDWRACHRAAELLKPTREGQG